MPEAVPDDAEALERLLRRRHSARAFPPEELPREQHDGSARATVRVTVERDGGDKPVCVAEVVSVLFE